MTMTIQHEEKMMNTDLFITEPADVYHAKSVDYLSSHQLIDFIRCPWGYHKRRTSVTPEKEETAFLVGRAAHSLILEGREVYENEFAVGGPVNPNTGKPFGPTTKKFIEWAQSQDRPVLPADKAEMIETMREAVDRSELAKELLNNGRAEGVVRTNYRDVPCQIRVDWFNPDYGIVDLKTCDDLDFFQFDAKKYRYHNQMAFYQSVLHAFSGEILPVYLVGVEKKEPFRCGVWQALRETLDNARGENEAAIERLQKARETDVWPTGYEELRFLSIN